MPTSIHSFTVRIIKLLFLYLHCKKIQNEAYIKMRSVTTRRFKNAATFKREDLIFSKSGQQIVNLISRIEFVSSVSYKFLPNTNLYSLITCIYDATCHLPLATCVTVFVTAQKMTDTTHIKTQ